MKKLFTLLLATLSIVSIATAQKLLTLPNDSAEVTAIVTDPFEPVDIHIELVNNTADTVIIRWGMTNYTAPAGWEVKLCDNNNCYDLLLGTGPYNSNPVAPGDTCDMKFQYTTLGNNGVGSSNVYAYILGQQPTSEVALNYKANLTNNINGINTINTKSINVFPNPVQNTFTVSKLDNAGDLSFEIVDMKGATMRSEIKSATNDKIEISIANLPAGVYILKALNKDSKVIGTARLTKVD